MSNYNQPDPERSCEGGSRHLENLEDGAGCTEIWRHLSEQRDDTDPKHGS